MYGSNDMPRSDLPSHGSTSLSGYIGAPAKHNNLPITYFKSSKHASLVACLGYMKYGPWYFVR